MTTYGFKPRQEDDHKYHYGPITFIGGSLPYGGAIALSSAACLYAGAGLIQVLTEPHHHGFIHSRYPELITYNWHEARDLDQVMKKAKVIVLGVGMALKEMERELFFQTLSRISSEQILIIDAGGLSLLKAYPFELPKCKLILTPHEGELKRLRRDQNKKAIVQQYQCILVAKTHQTQVLSQQQHFTNIPGDPAMAVAGMGDVLAGIIASCCVQIPDLFEAVCYGVYVHTACSLSLAKKEHTVLPSRLIKALPSFLFHHQQPNLNL